MTELNTLIDGNDAFKEVMYAAPSMFRTVGFEIQPCLIAIDPLNPEIILSGGIDSGLFLSSNGGDNWSLITDPLAIDPELPHIPKTAICPF